MPKFFNEVWLRDMSPKTMQGVVDFLGKLREGVRPHNLPADLKLLAGPWLSNEEAKVYFVFEINDPTETFEAFAERVADGLFLKRRLTLIQDWDGARSFATYLSNRQPLTT
ncbi:hypothetical protein DIE15_10440 [Burkholderia sp. Bp9031]|uniref:hypothetical protein n=1 Tax=Burkholderia sp. Bp9031 TaxID=2184566 RepID=UPI0007165E4E|nr:MULTISPECIES: hypothetical protein [Burkholderia]RQZ17761.1 hypothetical protein DIE15_10440 [Burkholderia sp. Bp9031]